MSAIKEPKFINMINFIKQRGFNVNRTLFEDEPDINTKNDYGNTALILASFEGYEQICLFLLENKANINIKNNYGETALIIVSLRGHKKICSLLLENGADVNTKNIFGETSLIFASKNGYEEICSLLLKNEADVNIKNNDGDTALMKANKNENKEVISLLISSGCNYSSNYKRISCNRLTIPTFRTFMIEYIRNQKDIKLKKLINIVPEEILDDINNKSISYCSKCSNHFYYYKYDIKLEDPYEDEIINVKVHCL